MIDLNRELGRIIKTGRVFMGYRSTVKNILLGRARLVIVAENCPKEFKWKVENYCKLAGIPLLNYNGSRRELGSACGKPFPVSVLAVREVGDSKILELLEKE